MATEPNNPLTLGRDRTHKIMITLRHEPTTRKWSVEIDGKLHEHVTTEVVEALVECELIVAEASLVYQYV